MKRTIYDLMYRIGAPWDGPPRPELVSLVESGVLTPARLAPGRAIDLGCGTGANVRYLARHGFEATGVDFSPVALRVARTRARAEGRYESVRFFEGDLTAGEIPGIEGAFDLVVDYGTLDDLDPAGRRAMAGLVAGLARPRMSLTGPSRMIPVMEPGEETALFGGAFSIERLATPDPSTHTACFLMTRS